MQSSPSAGAKDKPPDMMCAIEADDALFCIAEFLEDTFLFSFLLSCTVLRLRLIGNDDFWNMRLASFAALFPGLAHLDRGEDETAFNWYKRWRQALASAESMAIDHYHNRSPYMRLFGSFDGSMFVVHTPLRLPATQGLIAEVMAYVSRLGKPHAAQDAALMFVNPPANADRQFQNIAAKVTKARAPGISKAATVRQLIATLEQIYAPTAPPAPVVSPATVAAGSSEVHALEAALAAEQAHSEARERVLKSVRLRLTRTQQELTRAYARIAELELRVAELEVENAQLRAENRELKRRVAELEGTARRLEHELDDRPPKEKLAEARKRLAEARRNASAAAKKMRPIHLERARLVSQLRVAEERYTEAEEDLASLRGDDQLEKDLMNLREAEVEQNAAAQVAAAQFEALATIQGALDAELAARDLLTPEQLVERAIAQAEAGVTSPWAEKIAAHVMATKAKVGKSITLATTSASGRGRGRTYLAIVKHTKATVNTRELHQRTKELGEHLTRTSAGDEVVQLRDFIKSNKGLMRLALDGTWLSPPRSPTLHDLVALRNEVTGQMYETITGFFKDKCGVKFDKHLTKTDVKEACDDFKFEYDLLKWTEEEEKEVDDPKNPGKKKKVIVKKGADALIVKDAVEVCVMSAKVHAAAGRVKWPANVPADVWPLSIMIDAGAGITKVAVKHPCVERADGVRAITLLGVMVGAKDTYSAMKTAFGRIYKQISEINQRDMYVDLPWDQRVPVTTKFEFSADGVPTMLSCDPEMYLTCEACS